MLGIPTATDRLIPQALLLRSGIFRTQPRVPAGEKGTRRRMESEAVD